MQHVLGFSNVFQVASAVQGAETEVWVTAQTFVAGGEKGNRRSNNDLRIISNPSEFFYTLRFASFRSSPQVQFHISGRSKSVPQTSFPFFWMSHRWQVRVTEKILQVLGCSEFGIRRLLFGYLASLYIPSFSLYVHILGMGSLTAAPGSGLHHNRTIGVVSPRVLPVTSNHAPQESLLMM
jgi:hypothetical protein